MFIENRNLRRGYGDDWKRVKEIERLVRNLGEKLGVIVCILNE